MQSNSLRPHSRCKSSPFRSYLNKAKRNVWHNQAIALLLLALMVTVVAFIISQMTSFCWGVINYVYTNNMYNSILIFLGCLVLKCGFVFAAIFFTSTTPEISGLSDIGGIHDAQDINEYNEYANFYNANPLARTPNAEPNIISEEAKLDAIQEDEQALISQKNDVDLAMDDMNTFVIPSNNTKISCNMSWVFHDENKSIDLDLIVTTLDIYSFEIDTVHKEQKKMLKKSVTYKNIHGGKLINFKLDLVPANIHSFWFLINAYNGDSLKHIDSGIPELKAILSGIWIRRYLSVVFLLKVLRG